jgi:hypothetical protein
MERRQFLAPRRCANDEQSWSKAIMKKHSIVHRKLALVPSIEGTGAETVRAEKTAPRRWFSFRSRQPTTFHRCLALHLLVAERSSALD